MASTPASMLKIISSGIEDISRLNVTGQPSTSFYTSVYRQRTRWASQWRRVEFDNVADFGRTATVTLPILGELITRATLVVVLPDIVGPQEVALATAKRRYGTSTDPVLGELQTSVYPAWSWTNSIGHALCSQMTMQISNQVIDTLDSQLLEVIDEHDGDFNHFDTTNFMIGRDPSNFNPLAYNSVTKIQSQIKKVVQSPQTVQVVPPFWWNRGPGPKPLPIQALAKDKVQITCTFRPVQQCVYTDYRTGFNRPISATEGAGPLPSVAAAGAYYPVTSSTAGATGLSQYGRNLNGSALPDVSGILIAGTMPADYHFVDVYWIVEYVSLEDKEAAAFRNADLQIPIQQHVGLPVVQTNGAKTTRVNIEQGGLIRNITWIAQRVEAPSYNAYFLFSRDLAEQGSKPSEVPWWPNAQFPSWDFGDGYIHTGFDNARSDPLLSVTLLLNNKERFDFEGVSLFRSLLPIMNCKRAPLVNRYIYRYDFGMWSSGGLADAINRPYDEVRGCANWDKIPDKEIEFLTADDYYVQTWTPISAASTYNTSMAGLDLFYSISLTSPALVLNPSDDAYIITLNGAGGKFYGAGATLTFTLDNQAIQNVVGFKNLFVRRIANGSIALVVQTTTGYFYVAVAGSGGAGSGSGTGGNAGTVLTCGSQGGGGRALQTINTTAAGFGGGGGGGRAYAGSTNTEGPGAPDGMVMGTDLLFLNSELSTGGATNPFVGGDGYYGGGSGTLGGGGGGSYVSEYCTNVTFGILPESYYIEGIYTYYKNSNMRVTKLAKIPHIRPAYNINMWLTTYNMLRIYGGHGALMFQ